MYATSKLTILALSGFFVLSLPALADKKDDCKPAQEAKYCPKELTSKQIEAFSTDKKLSLNNMEFHVSKKFDQQAGKRYLSLKKDGKTGDIINLRSEKVKGNKVSCQYTYKFKSPSKKKEDAGKEVERTGRIRTFTEIKAEVKPTDKK